MKKILPVIFAVSFVFSAYSQKKTMFTGWSFSVEYGYNFFDGDISQDTNGIFPASTRTASVGGTVEYALTPIWGLALDYYFFPLEAKSKTGSPSYPIIIRTDLMTSDIIATINFTRWIFPETKSKFYIFGSIGLGFAKFNYDVTPLKNPINGSPTDTINKTFGLAGSVPVTFSGEYNFSKSIAAGLRFHYRAYTKDDLEGVQHLNYAGVTNDFIAAGQLYLRYKLNVVNKRHKRNITMNDYDPNPALTLARSNEARLIKMDSAFRGLEQKVDSQGLKFDSVAKILANDGPDSDGDGVPDLRDKDPNTPANTTVDFWGKPIGCIAACPDSGNGITNIITTSTYIDDIPAVYFDFDQIGLNDDALITIRKVCAKMKDNLSLMVEVRGYCDNIGNNPYNELLSQRRADRAKTEMVKVWGIAPERIFTNGKGKVSEPLSKYRPNRRCDFFFSK